MAKHSKKPELVEKDRLKDIAEEEEELREEEEEEQEKEKKAKVPKAVYRVSIILLVLAVGLVLWLNRGNLSPDRLWNWAKTQIMGAEAGQGFPVPITGSNVSPSNFLCQNGGPVILSDTTLTLLSASGKEEASLHHSFSNPVLRAADGIYLLYNNGGTGYTLVSGGKQELSHSAEREILAGDVSHSGKFALGLQGDEGASQLQVYEKSGVLQYEYRFSKDYITAIALNYDGSHGAVCTVGSEKGELVSKVTILDFNKESPLAEYETRGNLLVSAAWTEGGDLYAIGDSAFLSASSSDYAFTEYSYQGRQLTAFCVDAGRAFVSISAYEHAGPSTLLVFRGKNDPVIIEQNARIETISVSGGTVGLLLDSRAVLCDYSTGTELGRLETGADAKGLALKNESTAYILGVSEIREIAVSS